MPIYNKLVRDKIPMIIAASGQTCRSRLLDAEDYRTELRTKLQEEAGEYLRAGSDAEALEELADLLEVTLALAQAHGATAEKLEAIRAKKAEARGGFADRVFLIDVDDA